MKPDDPDADFVNAVRKVLEPRGLWGEIKPLRNGVISAGAVVLDINQQVLYIATSKAKDDPATQELAIALADAVSGVT